MNTSKRGSKTPADRINNLESLLAELRLTGISPKRHDLVEKLLSAIVNHIRLEHDSRIRSVEEREEVEEEIRATTRRIYERP